MSDYIRLNPWSVVTWAEHATEERPGNGEPRTEETLATLENILLVNRGPNAARLTHPLRGRSWVACRPVVYVLLMLVPLLSPMVMTVGLLAAGDGPYRPAVAVLAATAVALVCASYVGVFFLGWRRQPVRRRDVMTTIFTCLSAVFTAATLVLCHVLAEDFGVPIGWYVLPLWVLLALCSAGAVYQLTSPPDPAWGHVFSGGSEWSPNQTRFETHRLHPDDRARMLDERDQAVRILIERGLLSEVDPDELATRPLGELHRAPESTHPIRRAA